jgi:hypothetical protein
MRTSRAAAGTQTGMQSPCRDGSRAVSILNDVPFFHSHPLLVCVDFPNLERQPQVL